MSRLVSVLTPSLQQGRWLGDNLASVAAQDYPFLEHVVVDGGSTDGSTDILSRAASARMSWISEPDRGQADAINKAFSRSAGEIIGWLNSDDAYYRSNAVSLAVHAFERFPRAVAVYGHAVLVNAANRVLQILWAPRYAGSFMRIHNFLVQPAVFVRRSAINRELVDPALDSMVDWDLWLRLTARGDFVRVDRILSIDRHQPGRKVITRPDLAARDRRILESRYELASGALATAGTKSLKLGHRLVGTSRIREARSAPLAFGAHIDGPVAVLRRQLFVPRSRMALDG